MGQGLMDYQQCPVDGCWHIKRGLRFAMCYSQTSGRASLVGFLHAWRWVDSEFPREAEGGVSGSSRRIVLDIVCVFSNVIKGMCNHRCCFAISRRTYNYM